MPRIGTLLVEMKACSAASIREALQRQALRGGRLGTNLLDLGGALTEEALARALERQHGRRALFGDLHPQREALALLRPDLANRLEIVPYQLAARRLTVLCCDPRELAKLDEVAFATGMVVGAIIVPEARLWALLRAYYGGERALRGVSVDGAREPRPAPGERAWAGAPAKVDLMDEAEFHGLYSGRVLPPAQPSSTASGPPAPGSPTSDPPLRAAWPPLPGDPPTISTSTKPSPAPSAPRRTPSPPPHRGPAAEPADAFDGALVSNEEVLAQLQAEARVRRGEPRPAAPVDVPRTAPAAPLSFSEAVAELAGVSDRGAIARIVLRHARSRFRRAVLLTVHGRRADGWEGLGDGLTPQIVERIHVALDAPGVVRTVVDSRSHFLGPLARTEANIRLLRALAGGAPKNAFAMPILARGQVVNVLYADGGRGGLVDPDGVGELLILASKIAQSHEAILVRAR